MESKSLYWAHRLFLRLLLVSVHRCVHAQSGIILPLGQGVRDMKASFSLMVVAFITAFFLMGFFSFYYRHWYNYLLAAATRSQNAAVTPSSDSLRLRRHQQAIDQCPLLSYSEAKGPQFRTSSVDCAICLGELQDTDKIRLLPRCRHVFHPHCIRPWLLSRLTCPVCRNHLTAVTDVEAGDSPPDDHPDDIDQTVEEQSSESRAGPADSWSDDGVERFGRSHSTGHSLSVSDVVLPGIWSVRREWRGGDL